MKAENILTAIKNNLDEKIARLEPKVADDDGNSFINGMLLEAQRIRQMIKIYEKFPDWYGEKGETTMSEYKRLTEKRETPLTMSMWGGTSKELRIYNRLAELEDKIENGTLIEEIRDER